MIPADVVFVVEAEEHDVFERSGNALVMTSAIKLIDALCDSAVSVPTLDGRVLSIPLPEVVSPEYTKTIEGEGMPSSKTGKKGSLVIKFKLIFPPFLGDDKKE